jgi:BirA family biotin operon repressor/biotin-[acetyl-CoA-carboxylase] ligase
MQVTPLPHHTEATPSLAQTRALVPNLIWRASCPSTNTELIAIAAAASSSAAAAPVAAAAAVVGAGGLLDFSVVATAEQTAGRGRLGRVWSAPAGGALAVSVFLRHQGSVQPQRLGWLPLVAGVAMVRAVRALGVTDAGIKWPNDVLVDGLKLSGILTELTPEGVVVGAGLNLALSQAELPVPTATSLSLQGVSTDATLIDRALASYLRELRGLVQHWREVTAAAELRPLVETELQTLGRAVRVDRPGRVVLVGSAEGLDDDGRLRVRVLSVDSGEPAGSVTAVAAGDVTHLRYE